MVETLIFIVLTEWVGVALCFGLLASACGIGCGSGGSGDSHSSHVGDVCVWMRVHRGQERLGITHTRRRQFLFAAVQLAHHQGGRDARDIGPCNLGPPARALRPCLDVNGQRGRGAPAAAKVCSRLPAGKIG